MKKSQFFCNGCINNWLTVHSYCLYMLDYQRGIPIDIYIYIHIPTIKNRWFSIAM